MSKKVGVSEILDELIHGSGMTMRAISLAMGRAPNFIATTRRNNSILKMETLAEIADVCGYDVVLVKDDDSKEILVSSAKNSNESKADTDLQDVLARVPDAMSHASNLVTNVGPRLRMLRTKMGLTIEQVAEMTGYDPIEVAWTESDASEAKLEHVFVLMLLYGATPGTLFRKQA